MERLSLYAADHWRQPLSRAAEHSDLSLQWALRFNERLESDAWEDDPWTELAVALHTLAIPDPFPGTNAEWEAYFTRAMDRFERAADTQLDPRMRALIRALHPCRHVTTDNGDIARRA